MTESRFVLDTNAVIFLTTSGNAIPSDLENELDDADLFISVITEIELFSKAIVLNATLLTADVRLLRLEWPGFIAKNIG